MRLSLWQQFSSNHSDSFRVVGAFDSPESATQAAETIRALVARSQQWYSQEEYERRDPENLILLPELKASSVNTWEHFLFIYDHHTEDYEPTAYKPLVKQLGGQVAIQFQPLDVNDSYVQVKIICQAPDETTGQHLYKVIDNYFEKSDHYTSPWGKGYGVWARGMIQHEHRQLTLNVEFSNIGQALPKMIAYLRNQGCSEITYQIAERWYWEGKPWEEDDV
ncbi:MAG: hypothetical protein H0T73_06065 [Ardenticatenales bacterium]|nr:hypothetical protein [Ardenticatenales bacterium]